jgi:hypothetical protein
MRNTVTKIVPFVVFILAVASHFEHAHAEPDTRPNLLVIMADDLGFSDIGVLAQRI